MKLAMDTTYLQQFLKRVRVSQQRAHSTKPWISLVMYMLTWERGTFGHCFGDS